jgi:hypothetical protein
MVCQYSTHRSLSSENHETCTGAGADERQGSAPGAGAHAGGALLTRERLQLRAQGRGHRRNRRGEALLCLAEFLAVMTCMGKATKPLRSRRRGRWYFCATPLDGLAQDLQDVASELREFIENEHPMVRQRHFARQRHLAATDQPDIRDGVVGGAKGEYCDERGAVAVVAGHATDARGVEDFGQVIVGRIAR